MCCSVLIKTFDFFPERARLGMCVHAFTCVCESKRVRAVQKQSYMCICTRRKEKALGLLWCYLFSNLVILITVHIYLHFLFVSALDSHL